MKFGTRRFLRIFTERVHCGAAAKNGSDGQQLVHTAETWPFWLVPAAFRANLLVTVPDEVDGGRMMADAQIGYIPTGK
jgi:hypothetical protein